MYINNNKNNENSSTINNNENENYLQHSDGSFSKANFTLCACNTKPFDISKMTGQAERAQSNNNQTGEKEKEK